MSEAIIEPAREQSTHKVEVVRVKPYKHPNADKLDVVPVFGYTCVINRDDWKDVPVDDEGYMLVAYVPPDTIVDTCKPEFAFLKEKTIFDKEGNAIGSKLDDTITEVRTKAKRIRGIVSYGFIIPAPTWAKEGYNLAEALDVRHYEPALENIAGKCFSATGGECASAPNVYTVKYDVDSFRRYSHVFEQGEPVSVSCKLDGSNGRYVFCDDKMHCGSRTEWKKEYPTYDHLTLETLLARGVSEEKAKDIIERVKGKAPQKNLWWYALEKHPALEEFCRTHPDYVVYGEVFGRQGKLKYTTNPDDVFFAAFDIMHNGRWLDLYEARELASNIPWVPLVSECPYDFDTVSAMAEGPSLWPGAKCIREGVVVRPIKERRHPEVGRVQLKIVSATYWEKYR